MVCANDNPDRDKAAQIEVRRERIHPADPPRLMQTWQGFRPVTVDCYAVDVLTRSVIAFLEGAPTFHDRTLAGSRMLDGGGRMVDSVILGERRRALRVPVRGFAVLYANGGPLHGMIENLSQSGALISVASRPLEQELDLEIRLAEGSGWVVAHTVRVEPTGRQWRIAIAFDRVDGSLRESIDA